jgi:hypothetical protein
MGANSLTRSVGWVFIPTPQKLAVTSQKLAVMTYTGEALPHLRVTLPRRSTATKIRGISTALRNSTDHLTKNAITFYFELCFQ